MATASALYEMLSRVKIGDVIYIKSYNFNKKKLYIKGIGIVKGKNIDQFNFPNSNDSMGHGRKVDWIRCYQNKSKMKK